MLKSIQSVKHKVRYLLKNYPETRDDDKELWLKYLVKFHKLKRKVNNSDDPYLELKKIILNGGVPPMESVRRVRQKYQEGGKYIGTKRNRRKKAAQQVRDWARDTYY